VTKGIIVVASATLTARFVRYLTAALRDYVLRLGLVSKLLNTFQGLQPNVLQQFKEAQNEAGAFDAQRQDGEPAAPQTGVGLHGQSGRFKGGASMFDALFARVPQVGSSPAASGERGRRAPPVAADPSLRTTGAAGSKQHTGADPAYPAVRIAGSAQRESVAAQRTLTGSLTSSKSSREPPAVDDAARPLFVDAAAPWSRERGLPQRWEGGADGSALPNPPLPGGSHPPGVRMQAGSGPGVTGSAGGILWQKGRQRPRPQWAAQGGSAEGSAEQPPRPLETGGVRIDEGGSAEALPMSVEVQAQDTPVLQNAAGSSEDGPREEAGGVERSGQDGGLGAAPVVAVGDGHARQNPVGTPHSDRLWEPPSQGVGHGDVTKSASAAPGGGAVPGAQGLPGQGASLLRGTGFVDPWLVHQGPAGCEGGAGDRVAGRANVQRQREPVDSHRG
jgi:hypothetical protein